MEKAITRRETYLQAIASGDKSDLPNPITREEMLLYEIALRGGGGSGRDGLSAYELAVLNGFTGTEAEWLESLKASVDLTDYVTNESLDSWAEAKEQESINNAKVMYYSMSDGRDSNDGLSPQKPKKTLPRDTIENMTVLLKSGDRWNRRNLVLGNNVRLSTYGGNERAIIDGMDTSSKTLAITGVANVYSITLPINAVGFVVIDGKEYWKQINAEPQDWSKVEDGVFFIDTTTKVLSIKSSTNLTGKQISYSGNGAGISTDARTAENPISNVVIENIEVCNVGALGIRFRAHTHDVTIKNCYVHHIGGQIFVGQPKAPRYGNGIQLWVHNNKNILIENNVVAMCFDAGITPQIDGSAFSDNETSENIIICNNYISDCYYPLEYFNGNANFSVEVEFSNNLIERQRDITNGYRGTANQRYGSFIACWNSNNANDRILIKNNIGINSEKYAFVMTRYADEYPRFIIEGNRFLTSQDGNYIDSNGNKSADLTEYLDTTQFIVADVSEPKEKDAINISYYKSIGLGFVNSETKEEIPLATESTDPTDIDFSDIEGV